MPTNCKLSATAAAVVAVSLLTICTREHGTSELRPPLVAGDTVSISLVNRLVPDSLPLPEKMARAAAVLAFVRAYEKRPEARPDSQIDRIGGQLAEQLSRLSADRWSVAAGTKLYIAAKFVAKKKQELSSPQRVLASLDSLLGSLVAVRDSAVIRELRPSRKMKRFDASACTSDSGCLDSLLRYLFHLSGPAAAMVREFAVSAESVSPKAVDAGAAVKGLVSKDGDLRAAGLPRKPISRPRPNAFSHPQSGPHASAEALRYRSQQSIKDSIEKHIPDLESLYKKHLKMHQTMEGVVWAILEISPAGEVISAKIKASSITEKDFLSPFQTYIVRQIHFQKIPENAGTMSIEFPFEFSHEN